MLRGAVEKNDLIDLAIKLTPKDFVPPNSHHTNTSSHPTAAKPQQQYQHHPSRPGHSGPPTLTAPNPPPILAHSPPLLHKQMDESRIRVLNDQHGSYSGHHQAPSHHDVVSNSHGTVNGSGVSNAPGGSGSVHLNPSNSHKTFTFTEQPVNSGKAQHQNQLLHSHTSSQQHYHTMPHTNPQSHHTPANAVSLPQPLLHHGSQHNVSSHPQLHGSISSSSTSSSTSHDRFILSSPASTVTTTPSERSPELDSPDTNLSFSPAHINLHMAPVSSPSSHTSIDHPSHTPSNPTAGPGSSYHHHHYPDMNGIISQSVSLDDVSKLNSLHHHPSHHAVKGSLSSSASAVSASMIDMNSFHPLFEESPTPVQGNVKSNSQ